MFYDPVQVSPEVQGIIKCWVEVRALLPALCSIWALKLETQEEYEHVIRNYLAIRRWFHNTDGIRAQDRCNVVRFTCRRQNPLSRVKESCRQGDYHCDER